MKFLLVESNEDKKLFINKFGLDTFDLFNELKPKLKRANISTDITYHVKHTAIEEMAELLKSVDNNIQFDMEGRLIPTKADNYKIVYEDDKYTVYDILDYATAIKYGEGTGWCIAGRYETNGGIKVSQAKKYFNEYLACEFEFYLFCIPKNPQQNDTYCLCGLNGNDGYAVFDSDDNELRNESISYYEGPKIEYKGHKFKETLIVKFHVIRNKKDFRRRNVYHDIDVAADFLYSLAQRSDQVLFITLQTESEDEYLVFYENCGTNNFISDKFNELTNNKFHDFLDLLKNAKKYRFKADLYHDRKRLTYIFSDSLENLYEQIITYIDTAEMNDDSIVDTIGVCCDSRLLYSETVTTGETDGTLSIPKVNDFIKKNLYTVRDLFSDDIRMYSTQLNDIINYVTNMRNILFISIYDKNIALFNPEKAFIDDKLKNVNNADFQQKLKLVLDEYVSYKEFFD